MARSANQNATYPEKIACLIGTAQDSGHPFICAICGQPILRGQKVQFDHGIAVGVGGAHGVKELRPVHADAEPLDCHQRKTWGGRAKATTLGTDTFEAAKLKRLLGETGNRPSRPIPSRPFQKAPEGHKYFQTKRDRRLARQLHEENT